MANTEPPLASLPEHYETVLIVMTDCQHQLVDCRFFDGVDQQVGMLTAAKWPETLTEIREEASLIFVVPGQVLTKFDVALPARYQRKQLPALVKYTLEDQLLAEVEQLQFVFTAPPKGEQTMPVVVIAKQLLQDYLQAFSALQRQPADLICEWDLLPVPSASQWLITQLQNRVLIRTIGAGSAVVSLENSECYLASLLESLGPPNTLCYYQLEATEPSHFLKNLKAFATQHQLAFEQASLSWQTVLNRLKIQREQSLLPENYRSKPAFTRRGRLWQLSTLITAMAVVLLGVQQTWSYYHWRNQSAQLQKQIDAIYFQQFPNAKTVIAPKIRLQRKLDQLAKGEVAGDFWPLLLGFSKGISPEKTDQSKPVAKLAEQAMGRSLTIHTINFSQNQLQVELTAKSSQALQQLNRSLEMVGIVVKQSNVSKQDQHLKASLILRLQ